MKRVLILGATGSIGVQTIEVCENLGYQIVGITADKNYLKLFELSKRCHPDYVVINQQTGYNNLKEMLGNHVLFGTEGLKEVISESKADIIVNAIVGSAGILPTIEAIKHCKRIALANKETLVGAGEMIMKLAKEFQCEIIPVDSEHSAVFQCLDGQKIKKIHLTASGGPFLGYKSSQLEAVTIEDALKHPTWKMGSKITIDSATLMNKGLEVIEAKWLFNVDADKINVVIHPESIIHSFVQYEDNSFIAQLGAHDMRIPIQYAFTYPDRYENNFNVMDLVSLGKLTFQNPDIDTFKCLGLAYDALQYGNTMPLVLNAANEAAVQMFLEEKISFTKIWYLIEKVMNNHHNIYTDDISEILEIDRITRIRTFEGGNKCQ
ncbi:MAG: 1-deoxy-D-xylulose-5-phosphate reductoisomerase [Clostridia bacterium]|nr:1-deoxy-D-xylulose-5-phosphate reductoisomerase [Clostridia bacterium]